MIIICLTALGKTLTPTIYVSHSARDSYWPFRVPAEKRGEITGSSLVGILPSPIPLKPKGKRVRLASTFMWAWFRLGDPSLLDLDASFPSVSH